MIIKPLDLDISNIIKTASLCMNRLYMMMNMYIYVYIYIFYQTAVRCFSGTRHQRPYVRRI
jgi:hypothetical protein